jgi:hypothetical protein
MEPSINPYQSPLATDFTPQSKGGLRLRDLFLIGVAYSIGIVIGAGIIKQFLADRRSMAFALILGAILGTEVAARLYHSRRKGRAPFAVKATIGILLSVLCIAISLFLQYVWGWMTYPEIDIPFGVVGSFGFPFILFNTWQKALAKRKEKIEK